MSDPSSASLELQNMSQRAVTRPTWRWSSLTAGLTQIVSLTRFLANIRDAVLVSVAGIYVAGYIAWALNAWENNLGVLPAADLQYFVAGLIPVGTLVLIWVALRACLAIGRQTWEFEIWLRQEAVAYTRQRVSETIRRKLRWAISYLVVLPLLVGGIILAFFMGRNPIGIPLLVASGLVQGLTNWIMPEGERRLSRALRARGNVRSIIDRLLVWYIGASAVLIVLVWVVVSMVLLVFVVYPTVPQEFGGIRPRCAHLEVATSNLSAEALQIFFPHVEGGAVQETMRTPEVAIVYSSRDVLIIRPPGAESGQAYELRGGVVQAIIGCG